ncbi:MAG TPA: phage portal protein, partial [Rhodobiaceae bacterium]|nr:phage portal protein [Rhodobiaceae bacterium]
FGPALHLDIDLETVPALAAERESVWARVKEADFLSDEEKRRTVGLSARETE